MLYNCKERSPRFILVVSGLFLVFLNTNSAQRDTRDIYSNHELISNSALEKIDSEIEFRTEVIARSVDPSSEIHRKKRNAEDKKNSVKSSFIPSPVALRSTETNSNQMNERTKLAEKINGKRSDVLENEEEEEDDDEEDEDINEESSHRYKKRAGPREPKIWDQWGKWSCCSASCGTGKITRWRHCMAGGCASGEKEAQLKACQIKSCR